MKSFLTKYWGYLLGLLIVIGVGLYFFFKSKGSDDQTDQNGNIEPKHRNYSAKQIVDKAKEIADYLGTGWDWKFTEDDEKAAAFFLTIDHINFSMIEFAYNKLWQRDLKTDCTSLIDDSVKQDPRYAPILNLYGIF